MQKDLPAMKAFFEHYGLELSKNDPNWQDKTTIEVGFIGDDFVRNIATVRLEYADSASR